MRFPTFICISIMAGGLVSEIGGCSRSKHTAAKVNLVSVNDPEPGEFPAPKSVIFPADARHILPLSQAQRMLHPCSRHAPQSDRFWEPSEAEIDALEKELVTFMRKREQIQSTIPPPGRYGRQYIGFFSAGKPYIYGNYYLDDADKYHEIGPIDLCDGGPTLWGLVFDANTKAFSQLNFGSGF